MMERAGKNIKRVIIIAAAALLALCMAGIIMVWADGVKIEDSPTARFTDSAFDQYHDSEAESILGPVGSFHLVAFDTLHLNAHCNGNFATNDLQANSNNGTNNYGSEVNYAKHFTSGSPGAGEDDILVVGDRNTIGTTDGGSAIMLNGSKLDRIKHIIKSENFIDLADWKAKTQAVSNNYKSHSTSDSVTTDFSDRNNQKITVNQAGSFLNLTATSNGLNGIASDAPLKIDVGNGNNIVINVDCSQVPANGTLSLPDCKTILKGQELNNREVTEFNENFITWNFTNIPSGMTIDAKLMIGSILAPGATVNLNQNLNGTCAADTIYVKAESHRDDSKGTKPTTSSLTLKKNFADDSVLNAKSSKVKNIRFAVRWSTEDEDKTQYVRFEDLDKNGEYVINNLPLNTTITVTEEGADVEGYTLTKSFKVGNNDTTSDKAEVTLNKNNSSAVVTITNNYANKLKLLKKSSADKNTAVEGATYTLYKWKGTDRSQFGYTTITRKQIFDTDEWGEIENKDNKTNKDGEITLPDLQTGTYAIVETTAADGYQLTENPAIFNVTDQGTIEIIKAPEGINQDAGGAAEIDSKGNIIWYEAPKEETGSLTFTKTFDGYNVTDQDKNNITFTVKDKDGKVVTEVSLGKMTKGSDGKYTYTVANLTPGNYTVTENNADNVDGYTLVMNESVTSKGTNVVKDKDVTVELKDKYTPKTPEQPTEEKGSLTFTKTFGGDNVTEEDLKNISFTVTGPNNYSETYPLSSMQQKDGTYSKTLTGLTTGNYTVTENNADKVEGYTLVTEQSVTSKGTTVAKDQTATVELKDTYTKNQLNLGSLTFTKSVIGSGITKDDLKNITFTVTGPDNYSKTVALSQMEQGNGSYAYTITGLKEGQYTVTENNADKVEGYTFVSKESVTSRGTTVTKDQTATVELKDSYTSNQTAKKYALKVRKTENIDKKDTNKRIRGSRYAMFRWTGQIAAADAQDNALLGASLRVSNVATTAAADQKDPYARFRDLTRADIMKAKDWKMIGKSDTDSKGEIEKSDNDITPGVYAVMEEVPPAGYQRTANPAIIRLNEDGTKKMISNANGAAELETEGAVQFLRWRETATNVEINKVDEKGDSIKGAVLAIYDKGGAPVETWTSDGTKHRITAKLVAGETYTLKELKAPEGYEKAADETFTVESKDIVGIDQYIQSAIEMIDKTTPMTPNQPVKPAQTVAKGVKTGDPTTIGGLIALIAAAGAVTILTVKRLRDAE